MSQAKKRTLYGLKPYANLHTGFEHNRVETRDFHARPYVSCTVRPPQGHSYLMIFGWLDDADSALAQDQVNVVTMTLVEQRALRKHFANSSIGPTPNLNFW